MRPWDRTRCHTFEIVRFNPSARINCSVIGSLEAISCQRKSGRNLKLDVSSTPGIVDKSIQELLNAQRGT